MTGDSARPAPRTMIVDDHQLLAQSLGLALGQQGVDCHVPDRVDRDSVMRTARDWTPDLVLLDLDLGVPGTHGTDLVGPLVLAGSRVIVMTAATDPDLLARTLEDGASGIIDKRLPFEEMLAAVLAAARGEELMSPSARLGVITGARRQREQRQAELSPFLRLTEREADVLRHLTEGVAVTAIARRNRTSEATVRSQVRAILTKLGVTSQLEAVAFARRSSWS